MGMEQAMIGPAAPAPLPNARVPAAPEAPASVEGAGGSFADLLAGMLLKGQPAAQDQRHEERPQAAEIFNEFGLLGAQGPSHRAAALAADAGAAAAVQARAPGAPQAGEAAAAPGRFTTAAPFPSLGSAPASSGGTAAMLLRVVERLTGGARVSASSAAAGAPAAALDHASVTADSVSGEFPEESADPLPKELPEAAASEVQLSVEASEEGLRVAARADRLTREQRERLRGDIAALLAARGFVSAEIKMSGKPVPVRRF
jgi:hypothetical protein